MRISIVLLSLTLLLITCDINSVSASEKTLGDEFGNAEEIASGVIVNSIGMRLKLVELGPEVIRESFNWNRVEDAIKQGHIARSFYMGIYEVTQAQYDAVMGAIPSRFPGADRPVENISWAEAEAFCRKLSLIEGANYRLPSRQEWDIVSHAGNFNFYWIENSVEDYGWLGMNSDNETHNVGMKKPNPWGFYDMLGNVSECCRDTTEKFKFLDANNCVISSKPMPEWRYAGSDYNECAYIHDITVLPSSADEKRDTVGFRVLMDITERGDQKGKNRFE